MIPAFHKGLEQKVGERADCWRPVWGHTQFRDKRYHFILCNSDIKLFYINIKLTHKKIISILGWVPIFSIGQFESVATLRVVSGITF